MSSGIPKCLNMWLKKSLAFVKAVGKPGRGMRWSDFENQSTVTRMVMWPWDSRRSIIKSTVIFDQGICSMGMGSSLLAGRLRRTLAWAQAEQEEILWCTLSSMLGHQYLSCRRW